MYDENVCVPITFYVVTGEQLESSFYSYTGDFVSTYYFKAT